MNEMRGERLVRRDARIATHLYVTKTHTREHHSVRFTALFRAATRVIRKLLKAAEPVFRAQAEAVADEPIRSLKDLSVLEGDHRSRGAMARYTQRDLARHILTKIINVCSRGRLLLKGDSREDFLRLDNVVGAVGVYL
jgi:hypothetical protein